MESIQDVGGGYICLFDLDTCLKKFDTNENLIRHYKYTHVGFLAGHTSKRMRMLGLHTDLMELVLNKPKVFVKGGPLATRLSKLTERGGNLAPDCRLSLFYQTPILYKRALYWSFQFPHVSKHPWQPTVGIDDYSVICLSTKPSSIEDKGKARATMSNLLEFINQMEGTGNHPELLDLTTDGYTFNLYFKARRPLTDYFNCDNAAQVLAGLFYLKECLRSLEQYWLKHEMITRNPLLQLMFKRDNDKVNSEGVCFLLNDQVGLHEDFDNRFNNPWLPAPKDLPSLLKQCAGRPNM